MYVSTCHLLLLLKFSTHSSTMILNHFRLRGTFSIPSRAHTATSIAWGQISKGTQGRLRGCKKTHAPLAPMWIQKERKPRKEFTSKQVRQHQTFFTGLKRKVSSVDSDLRGILWSAPVCSAVFSHLPLEIEWEWNFFSSSRKIFDLRSSIICVNCLSKEYLKLFSSETWNEGSKAYLCI